MTRSLSFKLCLISSQSRQWREEKAELLRKLEIEEDEEQQKWSEKAKKELDDWYNRYNEQLEKVQNENRFVSTMLSFKNREVCGLIICVAST